MNHSSTQTCNCKWKSCKRRGNCKACIEHHAKSAKHPVPFCQNKKAV